MDCQSCGMPMSTDADHGSSRPDNAYCVHCTDAGGNLKPREEVREGMVNFYMQSTGKSKEEAEKEVETHMSQMPAWMGASQSLPAQTAPADVVPDQGPPELTPLVAEQPPVVSTLAPEPISPAPSVEPAPVTATPVQAPVPPQPESVTVEPQVNVEQQPDVAAPGTTGPAPVIDTNALQTPSTTQGE